VGHNGEAASNEPGAIGFKERCAAAFRSISVGDAWSFTRTFTEGDVAAFIGVTGDWNPIHIDEPFSRASLFKGRVIPGLLTTSMLTHIGGLLGWIATEMSFSFLKPVRVGDTVTCRLTITEKNAETRTMLAKATYLDESGVLVATATVKGFPSHIRLRAEAGDLKSNRS
jgi:acyl dehydratase